MGRVMKITREDISMKVRHVLVDALGVDKEEVVPNASLNGDLGAESIDWLDITFRLEKAFTTDPEHRFQIPRGDLFPDIWNTFANNSEYVKGGLLTQAGVERVRVRYPDLNLSGVGPGTNFNELRDRIVTVVYIENYIAKQLEVE